MALSGQLITNKYDSKRYYKLVWSAEQDIAANSSTISYTLSAEGAGWWAERTLEVIIGGITVFSKTNRVERWDGVIESGTIELAHNNDGSKEFEVSIKAAVYGSSVNCKANDTFTLDAIPRGAKITYISKFTDETNPVITYSNPAANNVSSIKITMVERAGTDLSIKKFAERTDISKTGTTYTFALTEAEREDIRNFYTTTNNPSVCFNITVVNGGATFNYSYTKKMEIVNAEPQLAPVVIDTKEAALALTQNPNSIINGFNKVSASAGAIARKGATITALKIINGSNTLFDNGFFENTNNNIFTFKVQDSRGNTAEQTVELKLVNYKQLTCDIDGEIGLDTADGTKANITIKVSGNYFSGSFGAVSNTLSLRYSAKSGDTELIGEYIEPTIDAANNKYSITYTIPYKFDYKGSYTVSVNAIDKVYTSGVADITKTLKAIPVFDWGKEDFNFNVPVSILGFVIDYPVEQGTKYGWNYTKWASGKAECSKTIIHNTAIDTEWGGLYYGTATLRDEYPFMFIDKPVEQVSLTAGNYQGILFPEKNGAGINTLNYTASYNICRPSAVPSSNYYINFYVCGKWR